jgi:CheY-like chemotaxis protein
VDDNEDTLHVTARILRLLGHQVTTANGAAAALQAAARETFDLVISDMEMPDGNGFDLMRDLVARRFIKGIAVTGYGAPEDIQRAKDAGFQKYLTKPIDIQVLQAAILELT